MSGATPVELRMDGTDFFESGDGPNPLDIPGYVPFDKNKNGARYMFEGTTPIEIKRDPSNPNSLIARVTPFNNRERKLAIKALGDMGYIPTKGAGVK